MKTILWDFDGVILDSMAVRDWGFEEIFKNFNSKDVSKLLKFHRENGGLSRYVKIRYFFEKVMGRDTSQEEILAYATSFSSLMKKELVNSSNLISDSINFIERNRKNYNFHIVSGSDDVELNYLCKELKISNYFISIHGSPTPKNELVKQLIDIHNYDSKNVSLIGDSINDYEAAKINGIKFYGYNNKKLVAISSEYIDTFSKFSI